MRCAVLIVINFDIIFEHYRNTFYPTPFFVGHRRAFKGRRTAEGCESDLGSIDGHLLSRAGPGATGRARMTRHPPGNKSGTGTGALRKHKACDTDWARTFSGSVLDSPYMARKRGNCTWHELCLPGTCYYHNKRMTAFTLYEIIL